jgi:hypothetical protein
VVAGRCKYRLAHLLSPAHTDASARLGGFPAWTAETTYFGVELEVIGVVRAWKTADGCRSSATFAPARSWRWKPLRAAR